MRNRSLISILFAVSAAGLLLPEPAWAQRPFWERYDGALRAIEDEDWQSAAALLQQAIDENPDEGPQLRTGMFRDPYYPHYWLGLANYRLGDCQAALDAWAESERQGEIQDREDEYAQLVSGRDECQQQINTFNEKESSAQDRVDEAEFEARSVAAIRRGLADIWVQDSDLGPREAEANRLLGEARAKRDSGQTNREVADLDEALDLASQALLIFSEVQTAANDRIESRAQPTQPAQPVPDPPATTGGRDPGAGGGVNPAGGGEPPGGGGRGAELPEREEPPTPEPVQPAPSTTTPAAAGGGSESDPTPPVRPDELDEAVDAYFGADYDGAIGLLADAASFEDTRVRLQGYLFRAAARFKLWVRGGEQDPDLRNAALNDVAACIALQADFAPDQRYFSPRFIALFPEGT